MPITLAVLLSGSGRTLQNLLDRAAAGTLPAQIGLVVSSHRDAFGLERARRANVATRLIQRRRFPDDASFTHEVFAACEAAGADLVCLAGFLKRLRPIPPAFHGRVMNVHPALLPSFGGQGYYGQRVHEAVLQHGAKLSGCTVHFVDDDYDHGPIIIQRAVPVLEDDDAERLAARVFEAELEAYPRAIELFAAGRLALSGRVVRIREA